MPNFEKRTKKQDMESKPEDQLSETLYEILEELDISVPWTGDFDEFMGNPDNCLVFD